MIPIRVYMRGFLSYRDEAQLRFDDASLWVLAGENGAGKSAIFDAITFALYGAHRGGKSNYEELINHDSDDMVVEFDFALDSDVYRVKRTLSGNRKRPSFQVLHLTGPSAPIPGKPGPQPIPKTEKKDGFNEWVRDHIGLEYETFTASVLLRQGESEALLKAEPKDRHAMLTQIVNLSAYERLCQKVEKRQKELDADVKSYQNHLNALAPVDEDEIASLAVRVKQATVERDEAQQQLETVSAIKVHAQRWSEINDERIKIEQAVTEARKGLLDLQPGVIESRELDALRESLSGQGFISESLMAAFDEQIDRVQRELDALAELKTALPWMKQFDRARSDWRSARVTIGKARAETVRIADRLATLADEKSSAAEAATAAADDAEQSQQRLTEAKTLLRQAKAQIERFNQVDGKPACGFCGQPLKPEHLHSERARLEQEGAAAHNNARIAEAEDRQLRAAQQQTYQAWQALNEEEQRLQRQEQEANQNRQQAERDAQNADVQAREALQEMPRGFSEQIASADIAEIAARFAGEFPTTAELASFSEQAQQYPSRQNQLNRLRELAAGLRAQQEQEQRIKQIDQDIDAIPQEARRMIDEIEADERAIRQRWQKADDERTAAEKKRQQLEAERERRRELESKWRESAAEARLYKELARLFGRDYLQRYLLKQAEATIVANANKVLDHLSGGALRLQLRRDDGSEGEDHAKGVIKALDLLAYNKQTGNQSLPVAFLSGSQRFRVAISLALGIGQYAGHASRRIESVIIDEGFGSLDKQGRSEMIDELHSLKNVLSRIILVSHQEEFASAFKNRYIIRLENGTSQVFEDT